MFTKKYTHININNNTILINDYDNLYTTNNYIYNCDYIFSCIKNNNKDLVHIINKNDLDKTMLEKICKLSTFFKKDEQAQLKKMIIKYFKLLL